MSPSPFRTLIFDIGDVLVTWSALTKTSISPTLLQQILLTRAWHNFDRGRISQTECYFEVGKSFNVDPHEIALAFEQARASLRPDEHLIAFIKEMKKRYSVSVFAMSNVSAPDYEFLRCLKVDWETFDRIFTSFDAGERKPDLTFYETVILQAKLDAQSTIFVDDKLDNVLAARSMGMRGIIFKSASQAMQDVLNLVGDPVVRAKEWLSRGAKAHDTVTETGKPVSENFAQMLIFELMGDRSVFCLGYLVFHSHHCQVVNQCRGRIGALFQFLLW